MPPRDLLEHILWQDAFGKTPIDRKRDEITDLLASPRLLKEFLGARISTGEFDLLKIAYELEVPSPSSSHTSLETRTRCHLLGRLTAGLQDWASRLVVSSGLSSMCDVSEGFSVRGDQIHAW